MIAVDTSAMIAIVECEPQSPRFSDIIRTSGRALIGTPTYFEFRMLITSRYVPQARAPIIAPFLAAPFELIPFEPVHVEAAAVAFDRFGKGRHPASLNYGDCMSYAIAAVANCPLLFKGNDFSRSDIPSAA